FIERVDEGAWQRGWFDEDLAVEQWALLGEGGKELWAGDLGLRQDAALLQASAVLEDARKDSAHWEQLAEACVKERRIAEAALAMARAAARSRSVEKLDAFLREHTVPRSPDDQQALAHELAPSDELDLGVALNG